MNILFICDEYPPGLIGGIGAVTQSLAREMVKQGHNVHVVGLYPYNYGGSEREYDEGVHVWRRYYGFNMPNFGMLYSLQRHMPAFLKRLLFASADFRGYCQFIESLVDQYNIDIIEHPDWISYGYQLGLKHPFPARLKAPILLKFHGSQTYMSYVLKTKLPAAHALVDKSLIFRADALAAVSAFSAELNRKLFDLKEEIFILHNGITISEKDSEISQRAEATVLFAGSLVPNKGIFQLLSAWPLILEKHPKVRLIIVGKGDHEELKKRIPTSISATVSFLGHQSRPALQQLMETATLCLLPSYTETFGLVAVESMSAGCPTIFTKRTCGPEIIRDGIDGYLVDPDDLNEIAEKTTTLLSSRELRELFGKNGRERANRMFNISTCVQEHISTYSNIIRKHQYEHR